ncbi:MAG: hypothetical protein U9Q62_03185 [Campylobacterota bacterium]|nr:hypothetical protein [Campylobacterota bacterium]
MYYVIQHRHNDPKKYYTVFVVPKFITSKENDNVIFEFHLSDGKTKRKWTAKKEIILLTDDEAFFKKVLARLTVTQNRHLQQIQHAEENLQNEFSKMASAMENEFEDLDEERKEESFPCLLKFG